MKLEIKYSGKNNNVGEIRKMLDKHLSAYLNNLKNNINTKTTIKKNDNQTFSFVINNSDYLDYNEIVMWDIFKNCGSFKIKNIEKLSRSFSDIHNVEKYQTEKFNESLNNLKKSIKPFYITKVKNDWWIGLTKIDNIKNKDMNKIIKKIYQIGLGMGLVPNNFLD